MILRRRFLPRILVLALVILGGGCTKEMRKARYVAAGDGDFAAGEYEKAEIEYRNALLLPPLDPRAIRQLGIIYYDEGRVGEGYKYLRKAAEFYPDDVELGLKLGMADLALGNPKDAEASARKVLQSDPGNQEAWLLLTALARTSKAVGETRQFVEKLRQANPDGAGYHLALGVLDRAAGDLPGAESECRKALALDPKSSPAYLELGEVLLLRHDLKQAGQAYRSAAELAPVRSAWRLAYVDFEVRTGAVDEAKKTLAEMTRDAPDYIPAWVDVMKLAFAERRYDDCAAAIQRILAQDPVNYQALLQQGDLKLARGDLEGAVKEFQRTDGILKRSPQVKFGLAAAYLRMGKTALAEDSLNQAIILAPNFDPAILLLAELNTRKGDPAAAVNSLEQLLRRQPSNSRAYLLLAQAYETQKNPDQALMVYGRMAEYFPKDPQVPLLAGMIWIQKNQAGMARTAFEESLGISADYAPAVEWLVDLDLMQKRYGEADNRVRELIKKYPKGAGPWVLRAKIDLARHDPDKAESDLLKAIDLDPKFQAAYLALARLYVSTNKYQQALDKLTALAAKTDSVTALMQLGQIHFTLKQFDAAREAYEKLLAIDPKYAPALNNLAYLYCENLGRLDKAYEIAKQARDLAPADPIAADTLGWVLFKRGDYRDALDLLEESAEKQPENPEVQYHLGMTHSMLGEEDLARLALQRAVTSPADFPAKPEARARLAMLEIDGATASAAIRADLESQLAAQPNDPVARVKLAEIQQHNGSADQAAINFQAALQINPRSPRILLELAQLYSGPLDDPAKARDLARSAHELAPDDPDISGTLGGLLYQTGDYKWSLDLLEQAAQGLPNRIDLRYDLARAYYQVGKIPQATETLQAVLRDSASFAGRDDAKRLASMIEAGQSPAQAEAALPVARKILDADPHYIPALMITALAREQEGDPSGAAQLYEKILAVDPFFAPASLRLSTLYVQIGGNDQRAYVLASAALDTLPDDPQLARILGILDYRRGEYAEAVLSLHKSLRQKPDDPEILYYLGLSHYGLKENAEGKAELQRALDLHLSDSETAAAKQMIADPSAPLPTR
jgi:tetratricopeptide (TPR) repeat protein